jgi:hyaluronan synthase
MRMLPWMVRNSRTLAFFYLCDILLPFLLICTLTSWAFRLSAARTPDLFGSFLGRYGRLEGLLLVFGLTIGMSALSSAIRQSRHLASRPDDLFRLPAFLLISTFFLMPIRLYGFVRMAHAGGWGTRAGGYSGERSRNPWAAIPYALFVGIVAVGTLVTA